VAAVTVTVIVRAAVRLPEVPLTVTCDAPTAAEAAAVNVSVLAAFVLAGLNAAVTPVGNPEAVKATVPPNPPSGWTPMDALPAPPAGTFTLGAEEVRLKPDTAAATVKAIVAFAERLPDVPVRVTVAEPVGAVALAVSVSVTVEPVAPGLNAAATPVGNPPIARFTVPVKPFTAANVIVLVPDCPCCTLRLAGAAANVKLGPAATVKATVALAEMLPEVAVTVAVTAPVDAEELAVNVSVLVELVLAGLNAAVTPGGKPAIARLTLPVNPFAGATVTVLVPDAPCATLKLAGASVMAKPGGGATVTAMATVAVRLPEVPLTLSCHVPAAAELAAVRVSALDAVALAGLNDAVTPVGNPDAAKATVPPKPPAGCTAMVAVAVPPAARFTLVGEEERVKPGGGATVKASAAFAEIPPEVAVTVRVAEPGTADALAVSVSVPAELMLAGLNTAVTPAGNPATVRLAAPVKPFSGASVSALDPDVPGVTLRLAGAAANVKLGAGLTVRPIVVDVDDAPTVPVTVTVADAGAAEEAALNVTVLLVAVAAGLNAAVTPLGRPATVRATVPVNPVLGVTVMVSAALAPCTTLRVAGEAASEKSAGGTTVKAMVQVALRLPDLPVTVTVAAPAAAVALAAKVNVLAVDALAGLNDAVTPLGSPETVRLTAPLNPLAGPTAILAVPVAPCTMVTAVGVACRLKAGAAVTVRLSATLALRFPEMPCTEVV